VHIHASSGTPRYLGQVRLTLAVVLAAISCVFANLFWVRRMLCVAYISIQETPMLTDYRGWTIDATPDFFFGRYFARARIVQAFADDREEPQMHIERDIEWFERKDDAIDRAIRWAISWIDARLDNTDLHRPVSVDRPTQRQGVLMADDLTSLSD
jgi:hypothetical protein